MKAVRVGVPGRPAHLEGLDRYEPGMAIEQVQRELGVSDVIKLASNENPLGASPRALSALQNALQGIHRYPDGTALTLRGALASRLQVDADRVVVGNGSTDLIDMLTRAYLAPGDNAVIGDRAFSRFRQCTSARNRGARLVPMRGGVHDLEAMLSACDARTRLLFVANPNNPTGTWNSRAEIETLLERLPDGVLVVLDEAYYEYAESEPDYPRGVDYVIAGAPVIVLRTFSKVYGLAGLRVGYGIAAPAVIDALDTVREPFNCGSLGQVAALAALGDREHVVASVELNRVERGRLAAGLQALGTDVYPSLGNFVCVETHRNGAAVFRRLLEQGVIVRPLRAYAMVSSLRVSVGTGAEVDRLLAAMAVALRDTPRS
jgi:histidinol-phosphate aminotransferase